MRDPDIRTLSREEGRRLIILRYRRLIGRCAAILRDGQLFNELLFWRGEKPLPTDDETLLLLSKQIRGLKAFIAKHGDADVRDDTVYHKSKLIRNDGATSPLCADEPRAVDLEIEVCILADDFVTCPECLKRLEAAHA